MKTEKTTEIIKLKSSQQVVLGVVYEPDVADTDGNYMTAAEIEKMAYGFMGELRGDSIDKDHNFVKDEGRVVESFIAREGDPDFKAGAWVIGVKVTKAETWAAIEKGELTGFSMAGKGTLIEQKEGNDA